MVLRELFAKLGLDVNAQSFAKGQLAVEGVKLALEKLAELGREAVHRFVEVVESTAEAGHELEVTAQSTGLTTEALQQLRHAADFAGVGAEQLDQGMFHLARSFVAAKKGSEEHAKAFHKLGITSAMLHDKNRTTEETVNDLAAGFAKLPDGMEKTNLAMEVLGKSGARLLPFFNKGRQGLDDLRRDAFIMSEEQIKAGAEMVITQKQLALVTRNLWRGAIAPLLPAINALLRRYLEWRKSNAEIMRQRIQEYIGYVIKAVNALGTGFKFLIDNSALLKVLLVGVAVAFALLRTSAEAAALKVAASWLLAMAPFVLLGTILGGLFLLFDDLRVYQHGGKSLYGRFKKEIDDWLKPNENDPWFLRAIKSFVEYIKEALGLILEFDEATNRFKPKNLDKMAASSQTEIQRRADVQTVASARNRVSLGLSLTPAEKAALARMGVSQDAFVAKSARDAVGPAAPSDSDYYYTPNAMGRGRTNIHAPQTNYVTIQGAGKTSDQIAEDVLQKLDEHWDRRWDTAMEDAAAGGGG